MITSVPDGTPAITDGEVGLTDSLFLTVHPNPFQTSIAIEYSAFLPGNITLFISDITGREIERLKDDVFHNKGIYKINFETGAFSSGLYFCTLTKNGHIHTRKIVKVAADTQ